MRELDQAIVRIAVANARRQLAHGSSLAEAAERATPGAWAEFRPEVLKLLRNEAAPPRGRGRAPHVIRDRAGAGGPTDTDPKA